MSYETGVVASSASLFTAIRIFAQANGWTLTGDVLSKNGAYIQLTNPSVSEIRIGAARNNTFTAPDLCPRYSKIFLTTWPASAVYHLAAFGTPDTLWCTLFYDGNKYVHLGFGSIQKYGVWNGGQWFHGQHTEDPTSKDSYCCATIDGGVAQYGTSEGNPFDCALFWGAKDGISSDGDIDNVSKPSYLECDLRGYVWEATIDKRSTNPLNIIYTPQILTPTQKKNPNVFNNQTLLTPFELFLLNTDGNYMSIGRVEHLRFVKLTNYNPGDVITIGTQDWKLFPWHIKDPLFPDGKNRGYTSTTYSTGFLGVAVKYDGPA